MIDRRVIGLAAAAALLVALAVFAVRFISAPDEVPRSATSLVEAVGPDTEGYRRAAPGTGIRFPEDHGPHPDYQLEWWYLTANLHTESGRRFGVQFTIFRNALALPDSASAEAPVTASPDRDSGWSTRQLYLAHAAVTDVEAGRFMAEERLSRGAAGLAFARASPLEVRVENWFLRQTGSATFPLKIRSDAEGFGFDLDMAPVKPVVLQGDEGFSPKGPAEGQASMYYSYTRMQTTGSVRVGNESFRVEGLSWMDREWSTGFLGPDQIGWDWFSIQLDDGRDLMVFQLRTAGPDGAPWKDGTIVDAEGRATRLGPDDFHLETGKTWTSARSGARYPVEWRLQVPREDLDLRVSALYEAQELNVSVNYWEGAMDVFSEPDGDRVGSGYLEMTGYAGGGALPGID